MNDISGCSTFSLFGLSVNMCSYLFIFIFIFFLYFFILYCLINRHTNFFFLFYSLSSMFFVEYLISYLCLISYSHSRMNATHEVTINTFKRTIHRTRKKIRAEETPAYLNFTLNQPQIGTGFLCVKMFVLAASR